MKKIYDSIYKFDTKGKPRIWYMEQDDSKHRTIAGIKGGNLVEAGWTQCEATNVGRSNERDPVQQATFEIEAEYEKKLTREYHRTLEGAGGGAHFFKPMLAEKYEEFAPGWHQPKLDGVRCIAKSDGLWSRQGKPIMGAPHVFDALRSAFAINPNLILDGELYNHELRDDFNTIVSIVKKQKPSPEELAKSKTLVQYHIYDVPSHMDVFSLRHGELWGIFCEDLGNPEDGVIQIVEALPTDTAEEYDEYHAKYLEWGFEGSIWRADKPYEQKRSKNLRKRKEFMDDEFEVVRIEEGLGNWSGAAKRVVCRLPDGREFGAGIKGSYERGVALLKEKHNIVTITYFQMTPDGIPRFGVATKWHGDKREL